MDVFKVTFPKSGFWAKLPRSNLSSAIFPEYVATLASSVAGASLMSITAEPNSLLSRPFAVKSVKKPRNLPLKSKFPRRLKAGVGLKSGINCCSDAMLVCNWLRSRLIKVSFLFVKSLDSNLPAAWNPRPNWMSKAGNFKEFILPNARTSSLADSFRLRIKNGLSCNATAKVIISFIATLPLWILASRVTLFSKSLKAV